MTRGRKALPDAIKALKGNPGKRRLNLGSDSAAGDEAGKIPAPEYVSSPLEKQIFARACAALATARFVRRTDADALARWATYLARWISIKKRLDAGKGKNKADVYYETASKHGKMLRVHPLFASMFKIEQHLMALEDRLGLNPTSRQAIIRGLINAPALPPGDLFADGAQKPAAADKPQEPAGTEISALGFFNRPH